MSDQFDEELFDNVMEHQAWVDFICDRIPWRSQWGVSTPCFGMPLSARPQDERYFQYMDEAYYKFLRVRYAGRHKQPLIRWEMRSKIQPKDD